MSGSRAAVGGAWIRFDRNELAGAFGDIGTDLPLLVAMIAAAGLHAPGVLVMFGLAQVATGLAYGLPMPMQPLKVMAMLVVAQGVPADVLYGGGLAIGVVMLGLSVSGLLTRVAGAVPRPVVRGLQAGLGLSLASLALTKYVPSAGPWGYGLAGACLLAAVVLWGNRRWPAALVIVGLGLAAAGAQAAWSGGAAGWAGPSLQWPLLQGVSWASVVTGFFTLALPQLPLSLSNSVIATHQTLGDLFPQRAVSVRKIGLTYAAANLVMPWLGGVPVCHGCGGLSGHHGFGGRTGGSVVIYGSMYVVAGLVLGGGAAGLLALFPLPMLGVILLVESLGLLRLLRDCAMNLRDLTVALLTAVLAVGLPHGFAVALLVGWVVHGLAVRHGLLDDPAPAAARAPA